jgi:Retroviral aspartyl protease
MHLPIKVGTDKGKDVDTKALLDSGAGGIFMDHRFASKNDIQLHPLTKPISVQNVDRTPNKKGTITHYVKEEMEINRRRSKQIFLITGLGNKSIILGLPWLQKVNPVIDWKKGTFEFREDLHLAQIWRIVEKARKNHGILSRKRTPKTTIEEIPDEEESTNIFCIIEGPLTFNLGNLTTGEFTEGHPAMSEREDLWIKAKTSVSQHLAHSMKQEKDKPLKQLLPPEFHQWRKVFEQTVSERFPESWPWDHAIDLTVLYCPPPIPIGVRAVRSEC